MYTIFVDDKLLYDPNLVGDGYAVLSPSLVMGMGKAGSLSFMLPSSNVLYNDIYRLKSIVKVYKDETLVFKGRVLNDEMDFYKKKNIYCEGTLSYLLDTRMRPYTFSGTAGEFFMYCLGQHNSKCGSQSLTGKWFGDGIVSVSYKDTHIDVANESYSSPFDELQEKLIDYFGSGYLRVRDVNGQAYLDLVEAGDYGIASQTIEFGKNLLDLSEFITAEDIFTVIIPVGWNTYDDDGNPTGRLTIESVNDGKDYIENTEAINKFGRIEKEVIWDEINEPNELLQAGRERLALGIQESASLTITAADLHSIDVNTDAINVGDLVTVISTPHNILGAQLRCTEISYDLADPTQTTFTFGSNETTISALQKKATTVIQAIDNKGADRFVTSSVIQFAQNQSAEIPPTDGWSDTPPSWTVGYIMWERVVLHYNDGTNVTRDPYISVANSPTITKELGDTLNQRIDNLGDVIQISSENALESSNNYTNEQLLKTLDDLAKIYQTQTSYELDRERILAEAAAEAHRYTDEHKKEVLQRIDWNETNGLILSNAENSADVSLNLMSNILAFMYRGVRKTWMDDDEFHVEKLFAIYSADILGLKFTKSATADGYNRIFIN